MELRSVWEPRVLWRTDPYPVHGLKEGRATVSKCKSKSSVRSHHLKSDTVEKPDVLPKKIRINRYNYINDE